MQRLPPARSAHPRVPLNQLLYTCIRQTILEGGLAASTRLPPSRDLAAQLGISRNTVLYAYEQLLAEGYTRTLTGSGTFVCERIPDRLLRSESVAPDRAVAAASAPIRLSSRGKRIVEGARASPRQWGAFMPGLPDVTRFPHRQFRRLEARQWKRLDPAMLSYANGDGYRPLCESLADYLRQARSVRCQPEQILVTEGVHQALDLVVRVLGDVGDLAWVEEPGYWGIRGVLTANGIRQKPVPVDGEGMTMPRQRPVPPRFAFVTPSHQYPLGSVMSMSRRLGLLEYAIRTGMWIVEDDYDSEFRFDGQPIPSLQGLLSGAPVIYIGTFSKTLYPGIRIAYMVLPAALAGVFRTAQLDLYRAGHLVTQAVLAEFIRDGAYAAHIRKMRLVYAARRAFLVNLIRKWLGPEWLHECDSETGLHLVLALPDDVDDVRLTQLALERGILVRPLSSYYLGRARRPGLMLGFASLPEQEMREPFEVLVRCIRECRASRRPAKAA